MCVSGFIDLAIGVTDDHSAAGASAVLSHRPSFVDRGRMFNPLASATRTEDTSSIHSASVADNEGAEINVSRDLRDDSSLFQM